MIFRQIVQTGTSFHSSLDATGQAIQRLFLVLARVLQAVNVILSALRQIESILNVLDRVIRALNIALRRLRAGPPPLVVIATIVRQLLTAARRVLTMIRRALRPVNQRLRAIRLALTTLRLTLVQVANRINLVRPEIQALIDLAAALEVQQEALEPLLPDAVKARIRALLRDIDGVTRQLDRIQSDINDRAATLEQIAATLEPIANAINAKAQALRAAVASIEGVAEVLSNIVESVEEFLSNIPLLGTILGVLGSIADAIDSAVQAILNATGISGLIDDAINALTRFDDLVNQLQEAAAQALQLDRIQRTLQSVATDLNDLLDRALQPIRDLLAMLRGISLLKLLIEVFLTRIIKEISSGQQDLKKRKAATGRLADDLARLAEELSAATALHPIPLVQLEALGSIQAVQSELTAAARALKRKAIDKAAERLANALEQARNTTAIFPQTRQSSKYFRRLAKLTGVTI